MVWVVMYGRWFILGFFPLFLGVGAAVMGGSDGGWWGAIGGVRRGCVEGGGRDSSGCIWLSTAYITGVSGGKCRAPPSRDPNK